MLGLALLLAAAAPAIDPPPPPSGWHRTPVTIAGERFTADGVHTAGGLHARIDRTRPTVRAAGATVTADDALSGVARLEVRRRGRWRPRSLATPLFDGTRASFDRWRHAGSGSFSLTDEGVMRTVGGLGLLWYPEREFGDAAFRFQWRAVTPGSNGGAFVRFPETTGMPCDARLPLALNDFAWHAVACGHEIQINDGDVDPQQTGSVYAFAPVDKEHSRAAEGWNDYEVRTVGAGDYEITVVRNGHVLNRFTNTPGRRPVTGPPSSLYPGTEAKQFATGLFGLQNHGDADTIEYRAVTALELGPRERTFTRRLRVRAVTVRPAPQRRAR